MRARIDLTHRAGRILGALTLALGLMQPAVHAFNPTLQQWYDGPIPLVFALGPAGRTLADGNTSWDAVAQRAADEWNANLGVVQFAATVQDDAATQEGDSQNTVGFSDTIEGDAFGDETIAVTVLRYDSNTNIAEADVFVNSQDTFDSYDGPRRDPGTAHDLDLHRVLLHEFGHVLGLDHPDKIGQKVTAIMNSVISDTDALTEDDTNGATYLYGDPALRSVKVAAYGVAVDDGRGKIFVATQKGYYGKGRLAVIDPYEAKLVALAHTGKYPNALALSGGGEHLYLGVDSRGAVDQIDPDTLATTQEFSLGLESEATASDLAVLPGAPESVLVSKANNLEGAFQAGVSPSAADFAVYDQGVMRPMEEFETADSAGSPVILDESGQTFYAFAGAFHGATSGSISRLSLNAQGVPPNVQTGYLATGDLDGGAQYSQGRLYGSDGSVANLVTGMYEAPFADVLAAGHAYTVEVNGTTGQAYFAVPLANTTLSDNKPTLLVEDIATRSLAGSIALPRYAQVLKMRHWGANGLILGLNESQMLLIRSNLLAPGPVTGAPPIVTLRNAQAGLAGRERWRQG